jgi:lysophospholipase L1-like esterase
MDVIGNSGYKTEQVTPIVPKTPYDVVILELGTNDAMKGDTTDFGQKYTALVRAVRAASPDAVLICAGSWQTNYRASGVDPTIAKTCTDAEGRYVPLNPLFNVTANRGPDKAKGVYGVGDNFHPNSKGHKAIAARLLTEFKL